LGLNQTAGQNQKSVFCPAGGGSFQFFPTKIFRRKEFLAEDDKDQDVKLFKKHTRVGRPLGQEGFIEKPEKMTGRILKPQKAGRKKKK